MRSLHAIPAALFGITLLLSGCQSLEEVSPGSQNAVIEDANARSAGSAKAHAGASGALSKPAAAENVTPETAKSVTETQAQENTVQAVPVETLSQDDKTIPTGLLPPVDETTAQEIAVLPDYATASGRQTCPADLDAAARSAAAELTGSLISRLIADGGAVYVAPTVIPDEFSDCIRDVSAQIAEQIRASKRFTVAKGEGIKVAQNAGSASLIPRTVRECRRLDIPYLAVSVVRKVAGNAALTVRIIRVVSGVTLTQAYKKLN